MSSHKQLMKIIKEDGIAFILETVIEHLEEEKNKPCHADEDIQDEFDSVIKDINDVDLIGIP